MFISSEVFTIINTTMLSAQLTGALLEASLVLPLGFFLRWHRLNSARLSRRLHTVQEQAAQAEARIRQDLAAELHDTMAKDLVRLVVLSDRLARHPDSANTEDFRTISELSLSASRGIRPAISRLDARRSRTNFTQIIEEASQMLLSRDLKLEVKGTSNLDALLTRQQLLLATMMVQECAVNVLKYGLYGSEVSLEAELDENRTLTLTMRNEISPTPDYTGVSSGLGLNHLESRLNDEGGELIFGKIGQQWIIKAVIPASREEPQ